MPKVITDEKLIDEVLTRGVETIFPEKSEFKKALLSGKKLRIYCGFDPSAPALHIGNAILINKLGAFQKLGHEIIFLIGDFTGMIGDPTDKTATRKKLTREEVLENAKNYRKQASAYLDFEGNNPAQVKYNSEWNDKLTFKDLIELASNFTLQQMINRNMFKRNLTIVKCRHCGSEWPAPIQFGNMESFKSVTLKGNKTTCPNCGNTTWLDKSDVVMKEIDQIRETPIGFHELLYPLAQAYDSVAMDVDLEVGGNDQMFNMLCGRDLMKAMKNKDKFVLTMKLLADSEGKKMGKSEGNVIWLDDVPNEMFGKVMSWSDGLIGIGFELCANIGSDEIEKNYKELKDEKTNPRDLKIRLAYEITKINHGEKKAEEAREYFEKVFSRKETPDEIEEVKAKEGENISDFMVKSGMADSKSDARRKIEQGGVKIDGETVKDSSLVIGSSFDGKIVKVGKREFRKISAK
jgi:tyrosyl-tRNA synthetase